jgi:hypothetical protein
MGAISANRKLGRILYCNYIRKYMGIYIKMQKIIGAENICVKMYRISRKFQGNGKNYYDGFYIRNFLFIFTIGRFL